MSSLVQEGPLALFFGFMCIHALADFPLQGGYIARQKSRLRASSQGEWIVALSAHCLIHAGGVWLVSGSLILGLTELLLHSLIDLGKGEGKYGIVTDQLLHVACKLAYVVVISQGWIAAAG